MTAPRHLVLARKYRPRTLAELVGQDTLAKTLTNAIEKNRIAQAYMLTGIRGTGKTSTARIIARALNCEHGPTATPCGTCRSCEEILGDRALDVVELDAATHTGVDDVRALTDSVTYAPVRARYKIYIIDEVHMLSKAAFNALLKTLEEPPPHAVFIFATTEIRKVPATIISRCQRFDLRRVAADALSTHFASICAREGVSADASALELIARAADGSVRDGLSILDQAIAVSDGKITADAVRDMLGMADRERSLAVTTALLKGDPVHALGGFRALAKTGADPVALLNDMMEIVHLACLAGGAPALAEDPSLSEAERDIAGNAAKSLGFGKLNQAWQALAKAHQDIAAGVDATQTTELAVMRGCAICAGG